MNPLIAFATIFISYNLLLVDAEKYVVVVPSKQIRRSPAFPSRNIQASASAAYPQHSLPVNHYGPIKHAANIPSNNQVLHGPNEIASSQNGPNYPALPYGKGPIYPYPYSAKLYPPYAKYKGGFMPLMNQNRYVERYPVELSRPRPQGAPIYGTAPPSNYYHSRPIAHHDSYSVNKNSPTRLQPIERPAQPIFSAQQRPFIGNPEDTIINAQSGSSSPFPSKVDAIVVKAAPNLQQEAARNGDLVKDSNNAVGKIPPASINGDSSAGQFVFRDTAMLDDYEKKIADFTQSWPKLSAFPGSYSGTSSLFPSASSFDPSEQSGVSRSSDILDSFNTSNRKGYEVKEDVDEPPFDYRSIPVAGSAPNQYQSVSTAALTKNLYVSN